ncbi:MAG: polyprenyl synthetase family protein [Deltaproteobacteria bacterium]|nr:polyprenyl synthetase family protein [Deltaproteobacteria bacterium]
MSSTEQLNKRIQSDIEKVRYYLQENLKSHIPLISEINRHILLGGGKRLRALLFILCSRLCGFSGEKAYYFSSIFEYLHAATLLHDDVIDNAAVRRGKASANTVWGNSASVLVGDFLLAKSFALAVETENILFLDVLSRTTTRMAEGMVLELVQSHNLEVTEETYREILINKTAILISAACQTGAIWSKAGIEEQEALAEYGLELGIAFQIVDDILDYTATQDEFGKPVGNDFKEGKITLPLIQALKVCSDKNKNKINEMKKKDKFVDEDLRFLFELIKENGGFEYAWEKALNSKEKAKERLKGFSPTEDRQTLIDLADFVVERRY